MTHWDLLLQQSTGEDQQSTEKGLLTFEVPVPPESWNQQTAVQKLPDHRLIYLDYQGPISKNRGSVTRVLEGTFHWRIKTETQLEIEIAQPHSYFQGFLQLRKRSEVPDDKFWDLQLRGWGVLPK